MSLFLIKLICCWEKGKENEWINELYLTFSAISKYVVITVLYSKYTLLTLNDCIPSHCFMTAGKELYILTPS